MGDDSNSRMVKRKTIWDISREIPAYPHSMYSPPPKPNEIPLWEILSKLMDFNTDIKTDLEENSPYQEGIIMETYQRPNRSYSQKPLESDSKIIMGKLVQNFYLSRLI